MKSPYAGLWLIVALALAMFLTYSFSQDISLGSWTVKKAPFHDALLAEEEAMEDSLSLDSLYASTPVEEQTVDSVPKSILIIGDSMTFNLALRLAQYAKQNGHTIHAVNWDSSNTKIWAESDTLEYFMKKYDADFVFISLGSNELYFKKPETRLPYVKRILEVIDTVPYIWIGPPNWEEDTGVNDMLQRACRRGSFFRTDGMKLARKKDKIHPTRQASAEWIDSVMRWMPASAHPILADRPDSTVGRVNPNIVFLKALNK